MLLLVILGVAMLAGGTAVGGAFLYARQKSVALALPPPPPREATPLNLQPRDVVSYKSATYLVEGCMTLHESGSFWKIYRLSDSGETFWLRVEELDQMRIHLLQDQAELDTPHPPAERVSSEDLTYRLSKRGKADVTHRGRTGHEETLHTEYFMYEGPGDHVMSIDLWGRTYRARPGRRVDLDRLELLPGDLIHS